MRLEPVSRPLLVALLRFIYTDTLCVGPGAHAGAPAKRASFDSYASASSALSAPGYPPAGAPAAAADPAASAEGYARRESGASLASRALVHVAAP